MFFFTTSENDPEICQNVFLLDEDFVIAPKARFRRDWVTYSSKYEMCLVRMPDPNLALFEAI